MLSLMFFQQFCGINAIVFYLTQIFLKAGFDIENSLLEAAVVSCTQVLATGTAILVVERVGRKVLLVLSSSVMCVAIFALGLFFYFDAHQEVICDNLGTVDTTRESVAEYQESAINAF